MDRNSLNVSIIGGEHFQCMDNHYAKFEYKGVKKPDGKNVQDQHPPKNEKILNKCAQNMKSIFSMFE